MAEFKLVIGDPKTGKSYQIVVTEDNAQPFIGKKIGDKVKGELFDYKGYEFEITGGADYCGFPMRRDVEGPVRKKILISEGVGTRNKRKGIRLRRTVCGNTIHERITQISMKILKLGKKSLGEEPEAEEEKEEPKEAPKEEKKPEEKKEDKPEEKKEEEPKKEEKTEDKKEKKEEKEETPLKEVKGIGPKTAEELKEAGVKNAEELAETDPKELAKETDLSEKQAKKLVDKAEKA